MRDGSSAWIVALAEDERLALAGEARDVDQAGAADDVLGVGPAVERVSSLQQLDLARRARGEVGVAALRG